MDEQIQQIDVSKLTESPNNKRKVFGDLSEMAKSVAAQGILQPLIVRPAEHGWEVVFGHRRLRAALKAGLKKVPAIVREMDSQTALELQLIENVQRLDTNELEQAEAYQQLRDEFGYTVDRIAERTGKPASTIYATLKLMDLSGPVRKLFVAGRLTASTAMLVARIPDERVQLQAAEEITKTDRRGDAMSVRQAAEYLQRKYPIRGKAEAPKAKKKTKTQQKAAQRRELRALHERTTAAVMTRAIDIIEKGKEFEPRDLRLMALGLMNTLSIPDVLKRRGVESEKQLQEQAARKMTSSQLRGLAFELAVGRWVTDGATDADYSPELKAFAKAMGLDVKTFETTERERAIAAEQKATAEALFEK